jgi:hypothetical protein
MLIEVLEPFNQFNDSLQDPERFLRDVTQNRARIRAVLDAAQRAQRMGATYRSQLDTMEEICNVLPALTPMKQRSAEVVEITQEISLAAAICFGPSVLSLSVDQLERLMNSAIKTMPHLTEKSPGLALFNKYVQSVVDREPGSLRVPNRLHCVWFGAVTPGRSRELVPERYLVSAAAYLHHNPNGTAVFHTDDIEGTRSVLEGLVQLANNSLESVGSSRYKLDDLVTAARDGNMPDNRTGRSLSRITVSDWREVFNANWGEFPAPKKEFLRSLMAGPSKNLLGVRDIFLVSALAVRGGIGFHPGVTIKGEIEVVDPIGLQCLIPTDHRSGVLDYEGSAAVRAARVKSEVAWRALERMESFASRGGLRSGAEEQLRQQPWIAIEEMLGEGCHQKFPPVFVQLSWALHRKLDLVVDERTAELLPSRGGPSMVAIAAARRLSSRDSGSETWARG